MGTGHVMRSLVLAHKLAEQGNEVAFICADLNENISSHVTSEGIKLFNLGYKPDNPLIATWQPDLEETIEIFKKEQPDMVLVDNYFLGYEWENGIRPYVKKIMVTDDYLNRKHDCDIFLNQNFPASERGELDKFLPQNCIQILGPEYAILRSEFLEAKRKELPLESFNNILISFGGTDNFNLSEKILDFFIGNKKYSNAKINCVVGWQNHNKEKIKQLCDANNNFYYHCQINYMARLMEDADLCIGAGGSSSWERLYMGVPSIIVSLAENQDGICNWLHSRKLSYFMGQAENFSYKALNDAMEKIISDESWKIAIITLGKNTVDGNGANRIVQAINNIL